MAGPTRRLQNYWQDTDLGDVWQCQVDGCRYIHEGRDEMECPKCGTDDALRPAPHKLRERLIRGRG